MTARLITVRVLGVAVSLLAVLIAIAGIPARFDALQRVCAAGSCGQFGAPPTPYLAHALHSMGLSLPTYAGYTIGVEAGFSVVYFILGVLLFYRARDTRTVFVAGMLVVFGAIETNLPDALAAAHPLWRTPVALLDALALASLTVFLYIFPDGRFVPRWTRPLAYAVVLGYAVAFLYPGGHLQPLNNPVSLVVELALLLLGAAAQIYRYRSVSGLVQRQQTKWVVFGLAVALVVSAAILLASQLTKPSNPLIPMAEDTLFSMVGVLMPVTIAIAILHYRLYDIDALTNRTLVYGSLTLTLGAFYVGSVIVLQTAFRAVTGQKTELGIAISTLALAALFNPWRHRVQGFIDRRFYRRRYDASRALARFQARLRDDVDMDRLREDIVSVLQETLQPVDVAIWLADRGPAA